MNTEEAIEEVRQVFWIKYGKFGNEKADAIIDLLEQGEKYQQMWEKLSNEIGGLKLDYYKGNLRIENRIGGIMLKIRQKYFPKGVK